QEISLSLCLGLGQTKDVLEGPFLNATTFGINELQKTSKLIAKPNNKLQDSSSKNSSEYKERTTGSNPGNKQEIVRIILFLVAIFLLLTIISKIWIWVIVPGGVICVYLGIFVERYNRLSKNSRNPKLAQKIKSIFNKIMGVPQ
ncbi:MAG: hypothetical protein F6K17_12050, partial [Okeania sp. SIO3C4]|nr:hypothetical protein [Okeania sp. SIO3C4]